LTYAGGFFLFKNFPFFNYVFFCKFFGFTVWFWSCWMLFSRYTHRLYRKTDYMLKQKTAQNVMEGEDKIVENMRKFTNDGECLNYVKAFKGELQGDMAKYRKAIADTMKAQMTERVQAQLTSVARFEAQMNAQLQETIVKETVDSFKASFPKSKEMQASAIDSAIAAIAGKTAATDPIKAHFNKAFADIAASGDKKVAAKADGSIVERVAFVQQAREKAFQAAFMVSADEAAEVKKLGQKAISGDTLDLTKLDAAAVDRLEALFTSINNKMGYKRTAEAPKPIPTTGDAKADEFITFANDQVELNLAKLQQQRLAAFVRAFA